MNEDEILELIATRLSINVKKTSEYNGNYEGNMYTDYVTVQLLLDDKVISESYSS